MRKPWRVSKPPPGNCGRRPAIRTNVPASHARALAQALEALASGPAANRARAAEAVVPSLKTMLGQLSAALTPSRVTRDSVRRR